jgi:hypothetical protein
MGDRYERGDGSLGLLASGGSVFLKTADVVAAEPSGSEVSRNVAITVEMRRMAIRASFTASSPTASERSARNSIHKTTVERDVLTSWQACSTRFGHTFRGSARCSANFIVLPQGSAVRSPRIRWYGSFRLEFTPSGSAADVGRTR